MARIRTIKPEFFRHEALQDLEIANPGFYPMMVFAGLWTQSDKNGVFPWKPRQLKLDILPFLPFDMLSTLEILSKSNFLFRYSVEDCEYGIIPTFNKHQRITGKEAFDAGAKYPLPSVDFLQLVKQQGNTRETSGINCEGREREKEKEKEKEKKEDKKPSSFFSSDSDEYRLSEYLFKHILKNNPAAKKPNIQSWSKHIDLMLRIDHRNLDEIKSVIEWCQKDTFWLGNILSTQTLRNKFDQLILRMKNNGLKPKKQNDIEKLKRMAEEYDDQENTVARNAC
jgi:hypothetical protein